MAIFVDGSSHAHDLSPIYTQGKKGEVGSVGFWSFYREFVMRCKLMICVVADD